MAQRNSYRSSVLPHVSGSSTKTSWFVLESQRTPARSQSSAPVFTSSFTARPPNTTIHSQKLLLLPSALMVECWLAIWVLGEACRFGSGSVGLRPASIILAAAVAALRAQVPVSGILLQAGTSRYRRFPSAHRRRLRSRTTGAYTDCGYAYEPPDGGGQWVRVVRGGDGIQSGTSLPLLSTPRLRSKRRRRLPSPLKLGTSSNINDLPRAQLLHRPVDLSQGNLWKFGLNGACHQDGVGNHIGGLLVWKDKLVADVFGEYSPATTIERSHFTHSLNLDAQTSPGSSRSNRSSPIPAPVCHSARHSLLARWRTSRPNGKPRSGGRC